MQRFLLRLLFFSLTCLCLQVLSPFGARADVQRPEGAGKRTARTPIAKPVQVEAIRGEPLVIVLNGLTSTTKPLEFIIRRQPSLGRLEGKPVTQGRDKGLVRYVAEPGRKGFEDNFTYSVKYEGSNSSEEAVVTVRIVDPAPVLEFIPSQELGTVLAGRGKTHEFHLKNTGNAAFRAKVPLPEGWSWQEPAEGAFDVAPGTSFTASLNVKPAQAGRIEERVPLLGTAALRFNGQALAPMQAYPSLLPLTWDPAKRERSAELEVANNSDAAVTVRISGPAGLTFPAELAVGTLEKKKLTVLLSGSLDQPFTDELKLDVPGWSQSVALQAAVAPAQVSLEGLGAEGVLDFGSLDLSQLKSTVKTLTLRNTGGSPASITWREPKFFEVSGLPQESQLAPGKEAQISFRPKIDFAGTLKDDWTLGATGGDFEVKLRAELDPEAMKKQLMSGVALAPLPDSGDPSGPVLEVASENRHELIALLWGGLVPVNDKTDPSLPKISSKNVRLMEAEPDHLLFEWDAPGEGNWTYRVYSMRLSKIQGTPFPVKEWGVMDNVKVASNGKGGRAEVTKLIPEARWQCRVVAIRSDGKETLPSEELTFFTPPVAPSRWPWILGGIVVVGALGYWIRRKWREDIKWQAS